MTNTMLLAEGQIVFDTLVERYAAIEPAWSADAPPQYRNNLVLRGLESLPVTPRR